MVRGFLAAGLVACSAIAPPVLAQGGGTATYVPPRLPFGQPNLQGVWNVRNLAGYSVEDHTSSNGVPAGKGVIVDPPDGRIPYQPDALAKRNENFAKSRTSDPLQNADPLARCYMPGTPRITYLGWPFQIFQTPRYIVILYEWTHVYRLIYLDRPEHVEGIGTYQGFSVGRFEGNSLVVDVRDFNGFTWLDKAGNFHSDALRVVERYTPVDADTIRYEATLEDPKVYTRPWTMRMLLHRQKEIGILDFECYMLMDESGIPLTWPREEAQR
jgi:hypothetical protein